nr:enoyl-CoA hydratase/isomerase family protein [Herbaspirillum sp. B65]
MNMDAVLCHISEGIAIVTLNNPPMNVVTLGLTKALGQTLDRLAADDAVRAVILTGSGTRAFCAGSDVGEFADMMAPGQIVPKKLQRQNEVFFQLDRFPKPTIASINGLAYGGGLEIALCCDLIVADQRSRLALPEIKLGVFPSSGGTFRAARRIGEGRAKEMIFLGEPIDAQPHWHGA